MAILSEEKRKELIAKKKYYRENPDKAKREYAKKHAENFGCIPFTKQINRP